MQKLQIRQSQQWGCSRMDFDVPGRRGFVILPSRPAGKKDIPWIWYAPSFIEQPYPLPKDLHRWYMESWLADGIAVGGVDVGESWGGPAGRETFTDFHDLAVPVFSLAFKACLLPQSRGGLMHYNWAVEHPDRVRCIGAIYPVCDVTDPRLAERICGAYGLTQQQLFSQTDRHNPVDRLGPLAKAKVPIFHVHGDRDEIVPLDRHSRSLIDRYRSLGGPAELLVVPGEGHEEISKYFQCQALLDFMRTQALGLFS